MKRTACLHRPAIAGIAALGLTTTALLAPAAHASSPTSEQPRSFTSAYTALLVPTETPPADVAGAAPADISTPIEEERSSQVTTTGFAASVQEEAAGAAITTETTADAPAPVQEDPTAGTTTTAADGSGEQGVLEDGAAAEAPTEALAPEGATSVAAGDEALTEPLAPEDPSDVAAGEESLMPEGATDAPAGDEAVAPQEASEQTAPAEDPAPSQEEVSGEVMLWANADQGVVCYDIGVNGVTGDGLATVHLHEAAGAQLLAFPDSSGCLPISGFTLAQIEENPNAFYVEVHTDQSPDGAARGFLTQVPVGGVDAGGGGTAAQESALPMAGTAAAAVLLGLGGAFALSRRSRGSA